MEMTDLGFYMMSEEEYRNLERPDSNTTYVLVNKNRDEYVVLRGKQYLGRIDVNTWDTSGLKQVENLEKQFGFARVGTGDNGELNAKNKSVSSITPLTMAGLKEKQERKKIIDNQLKHNMKAVEGVTLKMPTSFRGK